MSKKSLQCLVAFSSFSGWGGVVKKLSVSELEPLTLKPLLRLSLPGGLASWVIYMVVFRIDFFKVCSTKASVPFTLKASFDSSRCWPLLTPSHNMAVVFIRMDKQKVWEE